MSRPLLLATVVALAALAGTGVEAAELVGATTCGTCHPEALAAWRAGPHAGASAPLSSTQRADRQCLRCHAPAWEAGLDGVQCEACHGAGEHYVPEHVMRDPELARLVGLEDPGPDTCSRCHDRTAPSLVPFDYATELPRIRHWSRATGPAAE